ncbi:MAG: AAA family ATPase, partial [bacterium]
MNTDWSKETLFGYQLPGTVEAYIRDTNPWWQDRPMRPLPPFRRWLFSTTLRRLENGLAPVVVLRGPRQVGKTTLQEQIIYHLIHEKRIDPK